jgi:L-alanine-DL-glutamate epimerase-like enolase superfamily enzyme
MAKLRYKLLDLETATPFGISRWTNSVFRNFYLELLDERGNVGRGEGAPNERYGESRRDDAARLKEVGGVVPRLQGPAAVEDFAAEHAADLPALRAALSAAAWDLAGKRASRPIWELLGFQRPEARTSFTIAIADPDAMIARAHAAERFEVLKVKLGFDGDVELARRLADELPEKRFRYDVNEGWDRERAARSLEELGALGAELVEQPLPAADLEGQEWLRARSPLPVFADEALLGLEQLDEVYELYDGCVVKLDKAGGIAAAFSLISAVRGRGLQVLLGCMVSSSLGIGAGLQLAGSADFVDLDGSLLLARDPFTGIEVDGGILRASEEPGLGVEPVV